MGQHPAKAALKDAAVATSATTFLLGLHARVGSASPIHRAWQGALGDVQVIRLIFRFVGRSPAYPVRLKHKFAAAAPPNVKRVYPYSIALSPAGDLVAICSFGKHVVQVFDTTHGAYRYSLGVVGDNAEEGRLSSAYAIACTSRGEWLVSDGRGSCIQLYDGSDGRHLKIFTTIRSVNRLAVDTSDAVYVTREGEVAVFDTQGQRTRSIGRDLLQNPDGIAIDSHARVVVADTVLSSVLIFTVQGVPLASFPCQVTRNPRQASDARALAVDAHDNILVADVHQNRVCVYNREGQWIDAISQLDWPGGLAVSAQRGLIYVCDWSEQVLVYG